MIVIEGLGSRRPFVEVVDRVLLLIHVPNEQLPEIVGRGSGKRDEPTFKCVLLELVRHLEIEHRLCPTGQCRELSFGLVAFFSFVLLGVVVPATNRSGWLLSNLSAWGSTRTNAVHMWRSKSDGFIAATTDSSPRPVPYSIARPMTPGRVCGLARRRASRSSANFVRLQGLLNEGQHLPFEAGVESRTNTPQRVDVGRGEMLEHVAGLVVAPDIGRTEVRLQIRQALAQNRRWLVQVGRDCFDEPRTVCFRSSFPACEVPLKAVVALVLVVFVVRVVLQRWQCGEEWVRIGPPEF